MGVNAGVAPMPPDGVIIRPQARMNGPIGIDVRQRAIKFEILFSKYYKLPDLGAVDVGGSQPRPCRGRVSETDM